MTTPTTFADRDPSALQSLRISPQLITGVLLWIVRGHFSLDKNIVSESLKDFIYLNGDPATGITIEPSSAWNPEQVESRPAVYVKRGEWKAAWGALSIDNKYQSRRPAVESIDNGDRYEILVTGAHTLFCVGRTGAEAEELGAEVFFRLIEFAPVIRKDFNFHRFKVDELGEAAKLEESSEHWVVPVGVSYAAAHGWLLKLLGPYMKSVSVTTPTA